MASGDTLLVFTPLAASFPTSNAPTFGTRNNHLTLDFDDTTDETAYFGAVMPRHYSGSTGVTVTVYWMGNTQTTGDVTWALAFERHQDNTDDLDSDGFASDNYSDVATATTAGAVRYSTRTFTDGADMDSVAAGESFRLRIHRDADNTYSTDTLSGDAQLLRIELKDT